MPSNYRPLTETELRQLGYTTKVGSKYVHRDEAPTRENARTRREIENERAREIGYPNYSAYSRILYDRGEQGDRYRNFQARMQRTRGGIPAKDIRSLTKPDAVAFHRAFARVEYAPNERARNRALLQLFRTLGIEATPDERRAIWDAMGGSTPKTTARVVGR